jgi:hypothetical protein
MRGAWYRQHDAHKKGGGGRGGGGAHGTGSMVLMNGKGLWHNDEHVPAATKLVDM